MSMSAAEVMDATRDWLERAVIGLNLCPFAKAVHAKGQIRFVVTGAATADELLAALEDELQFLVQVDPEQTDTTLLIHPHAMPGFLDFHFFLAEADALLKRLDLAGTVQIAGFHPRFEFAGSTPDDIENYTNRSPYPILHLLREASVSRAVEAFPDAAGIFERNIRALRSLGHAGWQSLWQDPPHGS